MQIKIASYNIDGTFFHKSPEELLRERQFHSVPFLFGVNNHEFGWLIPRVSCTLQGPPCPDIISMCCEFRPFCLIGEKAEADPVSFSQSKYFLFRDHIFVLSRQY